MKKLFFVGICFIIGVILYQKEGEIIIPSDAIRIRIIANSNSTIDMYQKKKLKEDIKNDLYNLVKDASNSLEADKNIENNINKIHSIISQKTNDFTINYGKNYFPKKVYKGVVYNEGFYKSLVITLGKGLGENWWCVLYPPLCMINEENITSDVEYHSLIYDLLKN